MAMMMSRMRQLLGLPVPVMDGPVIRIPAVPESTVYLKRYLAGKSSGMLDNLRCYALEGALEFSSYDKCLIGVCSGGNYSAEKMFNQWATAAELEFAQLGYTDGVRCQRLLEVLDEVERDIRVAAESLQVAAATPEPAPEPVAEPGENGDDEDEDDGEEVPEVVSVVQEEAEEPELVGV